jgi:hypothetical protein
MAIYRVQRLFSYHLNDNGEVIVYDQNDLLEALHEAGATGKSDGPKNKKLLKDYTAAGAMIGLASGALAGSHGGLKEALKVGAVGAAGGAAGGYLGAKAVSKMGKYLYKKNHKHKGTKTK